MRELCAFSPPTVTVTGHRRQLYSVSFSLIFSDGRIIVGATADLCIRLARALLLALRPPPDAPDADKYYEALIDSKVGEGNRQMVCARYGIGLKSYERWLGKIKLLETKLDPDAKIICQLPK